VRFSVLGGFPKNKVPRVLLAVFINIDAGTRHDAFGVEFRQFAVVFELGNSEID
jgi:hypothetical protein